MKNNLIRNILGSALLLSASALSMASPIVINFDVDGLGNPIAGNTPITDQYASLGVLFEGLEDDVLVDINAAPDPDGVTAPSSPNVLTNCSDANVACPGNRADIVSIFFDMPVFNISLQLDSLGGQAVTFNLYDAADALLETLTISSGGSVFIPVAFTASDVRRVDGLQPNDGWAWAMDDLTFSAADSTPVPVPSTLLLLGLGLLGLGVRGRRNV
ncbi:MAG: PEP-CTERM sorting domain-containing protein [Haliea sp.]|uniref:PEP-CTERM sorting domain-containing protein n=1 Tax=Haliea sp. TaxID=1932666 RepID=UPI0032EFC457